MNMYHGDIGLEVSWRNKIKMRKRVILIIGPNLNHQVLCLLIGKVIKDYAI